MTDPLPSDTDDNENDPVAILFQLLVTLLAPLFLTGSTGKIDFARARLAASATLDGYHAMTLPELISVAQIIGFSLTTLGSLALSMVDDISMSMLLRLRGNANALSRSELSHHRTLEQSRRRTAESQAQRHQAMQDQAQHQQQARDAEKYGLTDAAIAASVAEAQKMAAEARANTQPQPPAAMPAQPVAATPSRQVQSAGTQPAAPRPATPSLVQSVSANPVVAHPVAADPVKTAPIVTPSVLADPVAAMRLPQRPMTPAEDHQRKIAWGTAMAAVAAEFAAENAASPQEQRLNSIRASALSMVARQLLGGASLPPAESHLSKSAEPPDKT